MLEELPAVVVAAEVILRECGGGQQGAGAAPKLQALVQFITRMGNPLSLFAGHMSPIIFLLPPPPAEKTLSRVETVSQLFSTAFRLKYTFLPP